MSYRRMGDGPRGGNRPFSQPFQSGPVNPWQGGSNANQGGILSQLTSNPQLALALTSLLQPQQQQPPSLLSLNTSPAFSNSGDYGRFNINRGRDFRRPEPYYKNNRGFGGGDNRRRRSPRRDNKKNDNKKFDNKKSEKKEEKPKAKEDGDVSMEDDEKESKRDWKDEKNQSEGKEGKDDESEGPTKEGEKEGKYSGVPSKYFNCFVCNKQMWDGESMGKHVRGRAHQEMMKAVEESIHICVNILRENMRLTEDRKMIEWNRQSRLKKFGKRPREADLSHCNMCDLKFMGKIVAHRRTEGHQRLKNYLHPRCRVCDKEFPSRLEWIDHRLTPEHLRNLHKTLEKSEKAKDGHLITEGDGEDPNLEPLLNENLQMESEDVILEVDSPLEGFQNRLPAYKANRPLATESLKEFQGWMCELCNRSFADEQNAQDHLKTQRHFYRFVEVIKKKFEDKEKKEKADKEADKKKKEREEKEKVKTEDIKAEENGEKEDDEEAEGDDSEMYDPNETTKEKICEDDEFTETVIEKIDAIIKEEEEEEEEEEKPEPEPEPKKVEVKEVKKEPPTPLKAVKKLAGPKSKRGGKK